jgi:hypothetical protein
MSLKLKWSYYYNDSFFISQILKEYPKNNKNVPIFNLFEQNENLETNKVLYFTGEEDVYFIIGKNSIVDLFYYDNEFGITKIYKLKENIFLTFNCSSQDVENQNYWIEIMCIYIEKEEKKDNEIELFNILFDYTDQKTTFAINIWPVSDITSDKQKQKELKKKRKHLFFEVLDRINLKRNLNSVIDIIHFDTNEQKEYFIDIYQKWKKYRNDKKKALLTGLLR